ncbi:MAG: hypothetical protein ACJ76H_06185 [Bacteriovoracaceae bacterium]
MKNNWFRYLHLFLITSSLGLILTAFTPEKQDGAVNRGPTSLPKPPKKIHPQIQRQIPDRPVVKTNRAPASVPAYNRFELDRMVKPSFDFKLSPGHVLAENISAIRLSDWKPGMPKLISDDGVYGYYQTNGSKPSIPVAYNPTMKKLAPISSVVHIKNVDEATRERLKQSGFQEYYYFKNIQRLSLKSSPGDVVRLYQELEKQGLAVKLEVIKDPPTN